MCGRVAQTGRSLDRYLSSVGDKNLSAPPRFNVGPLQPLFSLVTEPSASDPNGPGATPVGEGEFLTAFQWGLVPSWAKDITKAANAIEL